MKSLDELFQEIIREFNSLPTVDEKYMHLFRIGAQLPAMDSALKNEENKVRGCQSDLWFNLQYEDGHFTLQADSDSQVIKAIAGLLVRIVEQCPPEEVKSLNLDFLDRLQIWKLASERNNGLMAMLNHIKLQAIRALDGSTAGNEEGTVNHA